MTVNFEEIKDLIGKRVAIHCDTEEKARDLLGRLNEIDMKWASGDKLTSMTEYSDYGSKTCYRLCNRNNITYDKKIDLEEVGYVVFKYEITKKGGI